MKFIKKMFNTKCKFVDDCKYYDKDSKVCNEYEGVYYGLSKYAGCWVKQNGKRKK